jgi:hypothetical protein
MDGRRYASRLGKTKVSGNHGFNRKVSVDKNKWR